MRLLTVERLGAEAQGIVLRGNPQVRPEPLHTRVVFPGGDVDVVRCDDGSYWVHVRVNRADDAAVVTGDAVIGTLVDGRADVAGRHASDCVPGDLVHPDLAHVAVRVAPQVRT